MSQQSITTLRLSIAAAGAITARHAVGFDGAEATIQGQKIQGISEVDGVLNDEIALAIAGTAIVETGGVFGIGDSLIIDASGRAIKNTGALGVAAGAVAMTGTAVNGAVLSGSDLPEYVFADALEASTAPGQFVEVLQRRN